jgi:hypothetical protein
MSFQTGSDTAWGRADLLGIWPAPFSSAVVMKVARIECAE